MSESHDHAVMKRLWMTTLPDLRAFWKDRQSQEVSREGIEMLARLLRQASLLARIDGSDARATASGDMKGVKPIGQQKTLDDRMHEANFVSWAIALRNGLLPEARHEIRQSLENNRQVDHPAILELEERFWRVVDGEEGIASALGYRDAGKGSSALIPVLALVRESVNRRTARDFDRALRACALVAGGEVGRPDWLQYEVLSIELSEACHREMARADRWALAMLMLVCVKALVPEVFETPGAPLQRYVEATRLHPEWGFRMLAPGWEPDVVVPDHAQLVPQAVELAATFVDDTRLQPRGAPIPRRRLRPSEDDET